MVFKSHADTEVLLYALIHLGIERVLDEFDGMFAFAFYDINANKLTIARDRIDSPAVLHISFQVVSDTGITTHNGSAKLKL